jgi:hypothetical protein
MLWVFVGLFGAFEGPMWSVRKHYSIGTRRLTVPPMSCLAPYFGWLGQCLEPSAVCRHDFAAVSSCYTFPRRQHFRTSVGGAVQLRKPILMISFIFHLFFSFLFFVSFFMKGGLNNRKTQSKAQSS